MQGHKTPRETADQRRVGLLCALGTVLCWASAPTVFRLAMRPGGLDGWAATWWAVTLGFVVLAVIALARGQWRQLGAVSLRNLLLIGAIVSLGQGVYAALYVSSYEIIPVSEAVVINYLFPALTVLLGLVILRERVSTLGLIGLLFSFVGVGVTRLLGQEIAFNAGIALALGAALSYALFGTLNKLPLTRSLSLDVRITLGLGMSSFLLAIFGLATGRQFALPAGWEWAGLTFLGVVPLALGDYMWIKALESFKDDTARVANLIYLTPPLQLVFVALFLGEAIPWTVLLGLALIVAGYYLTSRAKAAKAAGPPGGDAGG